MKSSFSIPGNKSTDNQTDATSENKKTFLGELNKIDSKNEISSLFIKKAENITPIKDEAPFNVVRISTYEPSKIYQSTPVPHSFRLSSGPFNEKDEPNTKLAKSSGPRKFQQISDKHFIRKNKQNFLFYKPKKARKFNSSYIVEQFVFLLKSPPFPFSRVRYTILDSYVNFPLFIEERPVNGPLYNFFEKVRKSNSDFFDSDRSTLNLETMTKVTAAHKLCLICGVAIALGFSHKKCYTLWNLNPATVYVDENLLPIVCGCCCVPPFDVEQTDDSVKFSNFDKTEICDKFSEFVNPADFSGDFELQNDMYSLGLLISYIASEGEFPKMVDGKLVAHDSSNSDLCELIDKCISNSDQVPTPKSLIETLLNDREKWISILGDSDDPIPDTFHFYLKICKRYAEIDFDMIKSFDIQHRMVPDINNIKIEVRKMIQCAEIGDPECLELVGDSFFNGENGLIKNDVNAFRCYERAAEAEQFRESAVLKTAEFYYKGIGKGQNLNKAKQNYQKLLKHYTKEEDIEKTTNIIKDIQSEIDTRLTVLCSNVPSIVDGKNVDSEVIIDLLKKSKISRVEVTELSNDSESTETKVFKLKFNCELNVSKFRERLKNKKDSFILGDNSLQFQFDKNCDEENDSPLQIFIKSLPSAFENLDRIDFDELDMSTIKEVGSTGAKGQTYTICYKDGGERIFAKVFKYPLANDDFTRVNHFIRELKFVLDLHHPCIIEYIGFNECSLIEKKDVKKCPTLFMDYLRGDLTTFIENTNKNPIALDNTAKVKIILCILCALIYIHSKGVIHRDLKPENVLIDEDFKAIICDFGESRLTSDEYDANEMSLNRGSPIYIATEVIFYNFYGKEADIYSFAIVLFQLLTGTKRYDLYKGCNDDIASVYRAKVSNYRPEIPKNVPDVFKDIIEACWDNNIEGRMTARQIYRKLKSKIDDDGDTLLPEANISEVMDFLSDNGILPEEEEEDEEEEEIPQ